MTTGREDDNEPSGVGGRETDCAPACTAAEWSAVMPAHTYDNPKHWYDRAAEMRVLADGMATDEAQRVMNQLANDYDKLGDRAAERQANRATSREQH